MKTRTFPGRLTLLLSVLATTLAASWLMAAAPEEDFSIAQCLQPLVDSHALAGAVMLVADQDRILDLETVGYADVAAQKPMPADALFWIASMSKPMTATAVKMRTMPTTWRRRVVKNRHHANGMGLRSPGSARRQRRRAPPWVGDDHDPGTPTVCHNDSMTAAHRRCAL